MISIAVCSAAEDIVLPDNAAIRANIRVYIRVNMPTYIRDNVAVYMGSRSRYTAGMDIRSVAEGVETRDQNTVALCNWCPDVPRHCYRDQSAVDTAEQSVYQ